MRHTRRQIVTGAAAFAAANVFPMERLCLPATQAGTRVGVAQGQAQFIAWGVRLAELAAAYYRYAEWKSGRDEEYQRRLDAEAARKEWLNEADAERMKRKAREYRSVAKLPTWDTVKASYSVGRKADGSKEMFGTARKAAVELSALTDGVIGVWKAIKNELDDDRQAERAAAPQSHEMVVRILIEDPMRGPQYLPGKAVETAAGLLGISDAPYVTQSGTGRIAKFTLDDGKAYLLV